MTETHTFKATIRFGLILQWNLFKTKNSINFVFVNRLIIILHNQHFKNMKRKNIIIVLILMLLMLSTYLFFNIKTNNFAWHNNIQIARHSIDYGLGLISFTFFIALLLGFRKVFLNILAYFFIFILYVNSLISMSSLLVNDSIFTPNMAYSILTTNPNEAVSFSSVMVIPILLSLVFIGLFILLVTYLSKLIRLNKYSAFIASVWIWLPVIWFLKEKIEINNYLEERPGLMKVRLLKSKVIFNNYHEINEAIHILKITKQINETDPDFASIQPNNLESVENVIIVIGESARKQNMSMYGYERITTPNASAALENMFVYNNAISPAAFTFQSVPLSLSSILFSDFATLKFNELNNNIVSVASNFDYISTWITHEISKEELYLSHYSDKLAAVGGRDDILLFNDDYKNALSKTEKNMIILHFVGSHLDAKDNYPEEHNFFKENNALDEYDNSILYTDYILGKMFTELKNTNTAILYFSDHGQEHKYNRFFHAETKSANKVPLFIWYGDKVPEEQRMTGFEEQPTSIRIVYDITLRLMGLENTKSESHQPIQFLENGTIKLFDDLKD